uniref:hypothetical protein n=1 Tax=Aliarcobacter sp. TaxID=2321116 RepID=UPI0040476CAB
MEIEKLVLLLVGGVIGFVASISKDFFLEKTKENSKLKNIKREKLEEAYIQFSKWFSDFSIDNLGIIIVMQNVLEYDEYTKKRKEFSENFIIDFTKLEMIINIYGDNLLTDFSLIMTKRDEISKIKFSYMDSKKMNEKDLDNYEKKNLEINSLGNSFKEKIAENIKKI